MNMIIIMSSDLTSLLEGLPHRELSFAAGAPVFHLGDIVKRVYLVRSGTIHLIRHQDDGSSLILQRARAGAILAEASVYSSRYHCDARAESVTIAWSLAKSDLRRRLSETPELRDAWAQHLTREVQRARLLAEILSLKTVSARLEAWIGMHGALPNKGSWSIIAQEIGVSPEALYREIGQRRRSQARLVVATNSRKP
jgi:CRP-like cAMP-binding protein